MAHIPRFSWLSNDGTGFLECYEIELAHCAVSFHAIPLLDLIIADNGSFRKRELELLRGDRQIEPIVQHIHPSGYEERPLLIILITHPELGRPSGYWVLTVGDVRLVHQVASPRSANSAHDIILAGRHPVAK